MSDNVVMLSMQVLLFLVPGFIVSLILNSLLIRRKGITQLDKVFEALVFTSIVIFIYHLLMGIGVKIANCLTTFLYGCVTKSVSFVPVILRDSANISSGFEVERIGLLVLITISIATGLLVSWLYKFEVFLNPLRKSGLTKSSTSQNAWQFANSITREGFQENAFWLYCTVEFDNGERIEGGVGYFPDGEDKELYIFDPILIPSGCESLTENCHKNFEPYSKEALQEGDEIDGILIDTTKNIKHILFWKKRKD